MHISKEINTPKHPHTHNTYAHIAMYDCNYMQVQLKCGLAFLGLLRLINLPLTFCLFVAALLEL